MKCNLYSITKPHDGIDIFIKHYQKQCQQFNTQLCIHDTHNAHIAHAQKISEKSAQQAYSKVLTPYISEGKNIALHPAGKAVDSLEFAALLQNNNQINFFIAGAYGFEESFIKKCIAISLSPMIFSHQIVKIILCEQIYRALSIINHHPYHK
ncbi:hypothetical protein BKH46_07015 [Helicobacter sp. 12S02634-8]|uniref:23S rRNA (pseudouridine(1915)-N(3))-methyltransferase RlmH n=1 Tax=Helicobacter sp. 12S02634-8 TaxID=1476199 RepID=UPI000BA58EF9|nr:23S rRNA (pseudouridine(1915)-N(3))-methyltransferase RlmH [Helicobacter sp. 12S02634-8]PAF46493.1 hypothetical protein BKH46_07015 [Helicobacter sp. 12S02634-8]